MSVTLRDVELRIPAFGSVLSNVSAKQAAILRAKKEKKKIPETTEQKNSHTNV